MKSPTLTFFQNVVRNFAFCGVCRYGSTTLDSVFPWFWTAVASDTLGDDGAVINPFVPYDIRELTVSIGKSPGCRTEDSDNRIIVEVLSRSCGSCFMPFRRALISRIKRDVAFFVRRQSEICSSTTLTLCHSCNVFVLVLLSSLSRIVRRQSSMASLNAVTTRITIRGTAPRPGFDAPKMGNI